MYRGINAQLIYAGTGSHEKRNVVGLKIASRGGSWQDTIDQEVCVPGKRGTRGLRAWRKSRKRPCSLDIRNAGVLIKSSGAVTWLCRANFVARHLRGDSEMNWTLNTVGNVVNLVYNQHVSPTVRNILPFVHRRYCLLQELLIFNLFIRFFATLS